MLDETQIDLVRNSFGSASALGTELAAHFYGRLFERDPDIAAMFGRDMSEQQARLMEMLAYCVSMLGQPERLRASLADLGRRHLGYGVRPEHYDVVVSTLVDTLAVALGPGFTPAHRKAWAEVVRFVADGMRH